MFFQKKFFHRSNTTMNFVVQMTGDVDVTWDVDLRYLYLVERQVSFPLVALFIFCAKDRGGIFFCKISCFTIIIFEFILRKIHHRYKFMLLSNIEHAGSKTLSVSGFGIANVHSVQTRGVNTSCRENFGALY